MDLKLRGKVAVISGASVGIGLAVANGLAEEGVDLVMGARQPDRLTAQARRRRRAARRQGGSHRLRRRNGRGRRGARRRSARRPSAAPTS